MWLGTGTMRRRGHAHTAIGREATPPEAPFPDIAGWEVTAGRWRYDSAAGWVQGAADEGRSYTVDGNLLGYLMEGPETFHSAPWHDPAAPHGSGADAYLAKSVGADAIAYAGSHSQPDIHGGTGKGVEITQGSTAAGFFTATNVKAAAASTSDVLRCEMLFSIPETTGSAGTIVLRNSQFRNVRIGYDAGGNITGWDLLPDPTYYRAGFAQAGVTSSGGKVWFVWFETNATAAAANITPAFGLPTAIPGRKVVVHDLRILANPQTAPKAVPVLAASKTFAADVMVTGITGAKGVLFHRIACCRTKITDGRFSIAPGPQRSGPYVPYETRVEVVPSSEAEDIQGILPNEFEEVDFTPWLSPADFEVVLGPGYYNHRIAQAAGKGATTYSATSAFKNNPALMGQIERVKSHSVYVTNLVFDDVILFSRASEFTTQLEQPDLLAGTLGLNHFNVPGSISLQRSLVVSHPASHSRARAEVQEDDRDDQRVWMGVNTFQSTGGEGKSVTLDGSHFWRLGRAVLLDTAAQANLLTVSADDVYFDQIWSDCYYTDTGTFTINFNRNLFGRMTHAHSDLWQSRKEIEVDTGSGWQSLSASGLTVASLPIGRKATFAGTWDFGSSAFAAAPDPDRHLHVRSWDIGVVGSGIFNKVGYQWHASQAHYPNEDRQCATGDIYVIEQGPAPTPETPWVRLTFDLGTWTNTSTYVPSASVAQMMTGTHGDFFQVNRLTGVINSMVADGCVLLGRAQGMFLTGNPPMGANDSDIKSAAFSNFIVISDQSWSFEFDWSKTANSLCEISDTLSLPMSTRYRYTAGIVPTLGIRATGANNTIALDNVHVGHRTGVTAVSATSGGAITGSYTQVKIGEISGYAVTPPSGTPRVTDMLAGEWLDPFTYAVRNDIDPLDEDFVFTPYAESATGIALNSILESARGDHARWNKVKAQIARYHRAPDHVASVPASTPVGATVLTGLAANGWKSLWSGNEKGYFAIEDGALKVAKPLTGINQCWLLETDKGELVLVDIA